MSQFTPEKRLTGDEILKRFVPGYVKQLAVPAFGLIDNSNKLAIEQVQTDLLSSLKTRLDNLQIVTASR